VESDDSTVDRGLGNWSQKGSGVQNQSNDEVFRMLVHFENSLTVYGWRQILSSMD
jgi:hypothetical protein